jgi:hypothetical protein
VECRCGACGGRGEDHTGLNGGSVGNGGVAGTGLDIGTAIKDAVISGLSGGATTHDPADDCGCHTADTTTGNTPASVAALASASATRL